MIEIPDVSRIHPPLIPPIYTSLILDMSAETARKQEKDYTKEVDALIPEATKLAEVSSSRRVCRNTPSALRGIMRGA